MPPKTLKDFLPEGEIIIELEPEELAGWLFEFMMNEIRNGRHLNRGCKIFGVNGMPQRV